MFPEFFGCNPFFCMEQLQWQVICSGFSEVVGVFADSRGVGWCEHQHQPLSGSTFSGAWVYLHQPVPVSSPCSCHFPHSLVLTVLSPSLQVRISRPSLLIQPILSLFFFLLSLLSSAVHSNAHFTPMVHLSGSPSDLPLSFPIISWLLFSSAQARRDLSISMGCSVLCSENEIGDSYPTKQLYKLHLLWKHFLGPGPAVVEVLEPCSWLSTFLPPSLEIMCLSTPCSFTFSWTLIIRLYFKCSSSFPSACDHPPLHLQSL